MTNEEIITKALVKAEKNGYVTKDIVETQEGLILTEWETYGNILAHNEGLQATIFSHEFAKVFWPGCRSSCDRHFANEMEFSKHVCRYGISCASFPDWSYHLQIMVLEENPLEYLAKFLDTENE